MLGRSGTIHCEALSLPEHCYSDADGKRRLLVLKSIQQGCKWCAAAGLNLSELALNRVAEISQSVQGITPKSPFPRVEEGRSGAQATQRCILSSSGF